MNLKAVHYVMMVLTAVIAISQWVAASLPQYAVQAHGASTLAVTILGILAQLSPSAASQSMPAIDLGPLAPAPETSVAQTVATETKSLVAELQKEAGK